MLKRSRLHSFLSPELTVTTNSIRMLPMQPGPQLNGQQAQRRLDSLGLTMRTAALACAHRRLVTSHGSYCSGTCSEVHVLEAIATACKGYGADTDFTCRFAADVCPSRQRFIRATMTAPDIALFGDVVGLQSGSGECFLARRPVPVPSVTALFAGFPCKDISWLNTKARSNARVIEVSRGLQMAAAAVVPMGGSSLLNRVLLFVD